MKTLVDDLVRYVPALIYERFASGSSPALTTAPQVESFAGALLFADVTGFSSLTEQFAERGLDGVEQLTQLMNGYFERLIELVTTHGGDVVNFAGDSLLALWKGSADELSHVTRLAAQCGLTIQFALHQIEVSSGTHLSLRIGVGAGDILAVHIGGISQRWQFLVTGRPIAQVAAAQKLGKAGEVILSPEAWALVKEACHGQPRGMDYMRLEAVHLPLPKKPLRRAQLSPLMVPALRPYIPKAILSRLSAGQHKWLAELRRVTVLFINAPDLNYTTPLAQAQQAMVALQKILYRYEGGITRLAADDKGTILQAALGLPPFTHKDEPSRAIRAALEIQEELKRFGWRSAIGVTTGRVFCGEVGSRTRCDVTMMGEVVNLAARLMQKALGKIICDQATYHATQKEIEFKSLGRIKVKGKQEAITIYQPIAIKHKPRQVSSPLIGRQAERAILMEQLLSLQQGHGGGVIIICGSAGIGKSHLVEQFLKQTEGIPISCLTGAGDPIEKMTLYHAWRPVFQQLFKRELQLMPPSDNVAAIQARVEKIDPALLPLLPLLNTVLPLDLPPNELTAQLTGQVRADNTLKILVRLLQDAAHNAPLLLILEDAHWFDSASWRLTRLVQRHVEPLLLIITTRVQAERNMPLPADYDQLLASQNTPRLRIKALSPEDTLKLVCQSLNIKSLPQPVATLILDKADGHPFFSQELVYALLEQEFIRIQDGECHLVGDISHLDHLPDTLEDVIISRLARLLPSQQLSLKVASVIGPLFASRLLQDIYPVQANKTVLTDDLATLQRLGLTLQLEESPELAYIFRHIITQEVTYNLIPDTLRRQLHQTIASWYESRYSSDLRRFYPLLAHHWYQALAGEGERGRGGEGARGRGGDLTTSKAIHYLEKAGEQALHGYANLEAVHFFERLLELAQNMPHPISPLRQARWRRQLGEAYLRLGEHQKSQAQLKQAVAILSYPMPSHLKKWLKSLLAQSLRQVGHRLWPSRLKKPQESAQMLETARAYELLNQIHHDAAQRLSPPSL